MHRINRMFSTSDANTINNIIVNNNIKILNKNENIQLDTNSTNNHQSHRKSARNEHRGQRKHHHHHHHHRTKDMNDSIITNNLTNKMANNNFLDKNSNRNIIAMHNHDTIQESIENGNW